MSPLIAPVILDVPCFVLVKSDKVEDAHCESPCDAERTAQRSGAVRPASHAVRLSAGSQSLTPRSSFGVRRRHTRSLGPGHVRRGVAPTCCSERHPPGWGWMRRIGFIGDCTARPRHASLETYFDDPPAVAKGTPRKLKRTGPTGSGRCSEALHLLVRSDRLYLIVSHCTLFSLPLLLSRWNSA